MLCFLASDSIPGLRFSCLFKFGCFAVQLSPALWHSQPWPGFVHVCPHFKLLVPQPVARISWFCLLHWPRGLHVFWGPRRNCDCVSERVGTSRNESEPWCWYVLIPPNLLGFVGVGVLLGLLCLLVGCCVDSGIFKDNVRMEVAVHARLVLWWPGTDSSCYDLSMVSSWN